MIKIYAGLCTRHNFKFRFLILSIFFLSISLNAQTVVEKHGRLQVKGNKIVDKNGQSVSFAGNSLFWSNATDTNDFYSAATVNHLASDWNSGIVRVAMGVKEPWDGGTGYVDSPNFQETKIRKVIDAAIDRGIYVIIDWHTHEAEKYEREAKTFFKKMARLYGNQPNIIYEVYNEPINQSWSTVKSYSEEVIKAIRSEDPDNLVIVGSPTWSQDVDKAADNPLADRNTAYTLHFYSGTHKQWLRDRAIAAMNKGIALFITEWGAVNADGDGVADRAETAKWMKFCEDYGVSHVNWSVADKAEGASVVQNARGISGLRNNQLTATGSYIRGIIRNWSGGGIVDPDPSNRLPVVNITNPTNNASRNVGANITIRANASDSDGRITKVEFYNGSSKIGQDNTSPYRFTIRNARAGTYNLTAKATDNRGGTRTSSIVRVRVSNTDPDPDPNPATCAFDTPRSTSLPSFNRTEYKKAYILGSNGPSFRNMREFIINWDARYNGLYQLALHTNNGVPDYYVDFLPKITQNFNSSRPSISINGSGIARLDGEYWVTKVANNFVMVSKNRGFTIYFSNAASAPRCSNKANLSNSDLSVVSYPNPTKNTLFVTGFANQVTTGTITNLQGQFIKQVVLEEGSESIDVSNLNTGIYFLKLNNDSFDHTIKFVKQ